MLDTVLLEKIEKNTRRTLKLRLVCDACGILAKRSDARKPLTLKYARIFPFSNRAVLLRPAQKNVDNLFRNCGKIHHPPLLVGLSPRNNKPRAQLVDNSGQIVDVPCVNVDNSIGALSCSTPAASRCAYARSRA